MKARVVAVLLIVVVAVLSIVSMVSSSGASSVTANRAWQSTTPALAYYTFTVSPDGKIIKVE